MQLTGKQTSYLRGLAHSLKPLVQTGKSGLTEAVLADVRKKLSDHELIKVKITCDDASQMKDLSREVADGSQAALVQVIGHTAVLYRPANDPKINLPL